MLAVTALVVLVTGSAMAQTVIVHENGGTSTWYPVPTATTTVVAQTPVRVYAPATVVVASQPTPPVYASAPSGDPTGVADLRSGIVAARPVSSGDPRIDADNNRSDLEWGRLAQQRERDAQRAELEMARLEQQRERDAMRYSLDKQREDQRRVESWSRVVRDQLNDSTRRETERQRAELAQRQQRQRELESASRSVQQLSESIARNRARR